MDLGGGWLSFHSHSRFPRKSRRTGHPSYWLLLHLLLPLSSNIRFIKTHRQQVTKKERWKAYLWDWRCSRSTYSLCSKSAILPISSRKSLERKKVGKNCNSRDCFDLQDIISKTGLKALHWVRIVMSSALSPWLYDEVKFPLFDSRLWGFNVWAHYISIATRPPIIFPILNSTQWVRFKASAFQSLARPAGQNSTKGDSLSVQTEKLDTGAGDGIYVGRSTSFA